MKEELGAGIDDGLTEVAAAIGRAYEVESAKNEEMFRAREYTKEMRQRARRIGLRFLIVGVVMTLAGVWMLVLSVETGRLRGIQVVMLIFGVAMTAARLIQVVSGRSVIRK